MDHLCHVLRVRDDSKAAVVGPDARIATHEHRGGAESRDWKGVASLGEGQVRDRMARPRTDYATPRTREQETDEGAAPYNSALQLRTDCDWPAEGVDGAGEGVVGGGRRGQDGTHSGSEQARHVDGQGADGSDEEEEREEEEEEEEERNRGNCGDGPAGTIGCVACIGCLNHENTEVLSRIKTVAPSDFLAICFLLCFVWNKLDQWKIEKVGSEPAPGSTRPTYRVPTTRTRQMY